jgi:hypothetical protein
MGLTMKSEDYKIYVPLARNLLQDILNLAFPPRIITRGTLEYLPPREDFPRLGVHYFAQDVNNLKAFSALSNQLLDIPKIKGKFDEIALEKCIFSLAEAVFGSSPPFEIAEQAFSKYWNLFTDLLDKSKVQVRTIIGLSNFESPIPLYRISKETSIHYFAGSDLAANIDRFLHAWDHDGLSKSLHDANARERKGALIIDKIYEANENTISYHHYNAECIDLMVRAVRAMRLAGFGQLQSGPWMIICNPDFPLEKLAVIPGARSNSYKKEPSFKLTKKCGNRIKTTISLLDKLAEDDKNSREDFRNVRNRFQVAFNRIEETYEAGPYEISIVNIAIALEALLARNNK